MRRIGALSVLLALLCGCGLAATGAAGAAGAESAGQEAARARQTEEHVRQQLDAAAVQAQEQRTDAEKQAQ